LSEVDSSDITLKSIEVENEKLHRKVDELSKKNDKLSKELDSANIKYLNCQNNAELVASAHQNEIKRLKVMLEVFHQESSSSKLSSTDIISKLNDSLTEKDIEIRKLQTDIINLNAEFQNSRIHDLGCREHTEIKCANCSDLESKLSVLRWQIDSLNTKKEAIDKVCRHSRFILI
jgi:hypothetical protein